MTDTEVKQPSLPAEGGGESEKKELKYLDFVQVAAIYMIVSFSALYDYAKENSGPLKPGVETVEGTVKAVLGPVYDKFCDVPSELLKFVDRKVDESINELGGHVPTLLKQASHQLLLAAQKAPELARGVVSEVQRVGLVDAATSASKTLCLQYEPLVEQYAVTAWRRLNQLPLFPQLAQIIVPTAAYWCEKYNAAVAYTAQRGYTVSYYLPAVPVDRIAKLFGSAESGPAVSSTNGREPLAVST